jgi:hypothetical protein
MKRIILQFSILFLFKQLILNNNFKFSRNEKNKI